MTFRLKNGRGKTLAYSHLDAIDDDNPNLGCAIEFTRHRVILKGRNLAELVRLLGVHKVREVVEVDEIHSLTHSPDAPVVTAIEVQEKREREEW